MSQGARFSRTSSKRRGRGKSNHKKKISEEELERKAEEFERALALQRSTLKGHEHKAAPQAFNRMPHVSGMVYDEKKDRYFPKKKKVDEILSVPMKRNESLSTARYLRSRELQKLGRAGYDSVVSGIMGKTTGDQLRQTALNDDTSDSRGCAEMLLSSKQNSFLREYVCEEEV